MKRHPREQVTDRARAELRAMLLEWSKKYDLTTAEELIVITTTTQDVVSGALKYVIRDERHGDPDKPGGVE